MLLSVLDLALLSSSSSAAAQTYTCGTSDDADALHFRNYIALLVTAPPSDTAHASKRSNYQLPAASAADVTIETERQTCDAAGAAMNAVTNPPNATHLVVVKVGDTRYVVLDQDLHESSEWRQRIVFDAAWNALAKFAG